MAGGRVSWATHKSENIIRAEQQAKSLWRILNGKDGKGNNMAVVEFDDKSVGNRQDFFKFPLGISRVCILSKQAILEKIHYEGGYIKCLGPQDAWCSQGKEPEERFASFLVVYNTNNEGVPYDPLTFRIEPWAYGSDKFATLRIVKTNFGDLRTHDLLVTCTEFKYQKMTIQGLPEAWWTKNDQFKMAVVEAFKKKEAEFPLDKKIARTIPLHEQMEYISKRRQRNNPQQGQNGQGANVGFNPMAAVQGMMQQQYNPGMGAAPNFGANPGVTPTGPSFAQPQGPVTGSSTPMAPQQVTQHVQPAPAAGGEVDLDALLDGMKT